MTQTTRPELDGGFSQKVLRYFLTFLQTDFKKQQAPRRRILMKSEAGFRVGLPLRKYGSLFSVVWNFVANAPRDGLILKIAPGQYRAPISPTLRDLIHKHVENVEDDVFTAISKGTIDYAVRNREKSIEDPERFVESVQVHFVEEIGTELINELLSRLDGPFREAAYSAIESIYDVEADLTDAIAANVVEHLPPALNSLIVSGETTAIEAVLQEFFTANDVRAQLKSFFDDFATADAFQEVRDLQHSLRSAENQSFYLYLCDIRFGAHAFPLFYVPATLTYNEDDRAFLIEFDPHLLINKQAIDWILQEQEAVASRLPISPITDRVLYLDASQSFLREMERAFAKLLPSFEIATGIDLGAKRLQQVSSPTLKISTACYFAIFDKSDESLLNDYEELLTAFDDNQNGAAQLFQNIIEGFIYENPPSIAAVVDRSWDETEIPDRLVAEAPIPVNEEQRKILSALKDSSCHYISVQGPPGTGKSHTITAIAFDSIIRGKNVLVLSDKTEALDVVQDKLESVLTRVRHGDDDFPNPILRLGRTGNTYNRLVSASAREKIKNHFQAASKHAASLEQEAVGTCEALRSSIATTVEALSTIQLQEVEELHRLEAEISAITPGLVGHLQKPAVPEKVADLAAIASKIDQKECAFIAQRVRAEPDGDSFGAWIPTLATWRVASQLLESAGPVSALRTFTSLHSDHHPQLLRFIAEYESLRLPLFGWLFSSRKVQLLNVRVATAIPCSDAIDLHKRLADIKSATRALGLICEGLGRERLEKHAEFAYRVLRDGEAASKGVAELAALTEAYGLVVFGSASAADAVIEPREFPSSDALIGLLIKSCRYAVLWREISARMAMVPHLDYVGTKSRVEQLNTARMTHEIDRRFLDFVENKKATVKEIGGVIRGKQKFPEEEFHHLSDAFPVIVAGIREYAEYVPLKDRLFDLVVIDEASQVSVAQALPALLRAEKVIVFGDAKQFSNVKSAQASNAINSGYLTDLEACFRAKVSGAATKIQRLKHFDVKKSILEFFDLIANYQTMLRKHFRGYQELISFSSQHFYEGQLQAIKIRSKPLSEIIRFEVLQPAESEGRKNVNKTEAEFICKELRRLVDAQVTTTVGVITPFREQVRLLNEILYRDSYADKFDSDLHLKVMTFDTCQGEERDLIIFSMVATAHRDVLNYIFPTTLEGLSDKAEETIKAQRLNVGFSRAKEGFLFVLSKPVEDFKGSIGRVLMHYKKLCEDRSRPDESRVDPSSPMEKKVLDWIFKTAFYQLNESKIEVVPQFPIGEYLKQLDPFYAHPAYRCDFLVRYYDPQGTVNVVIEYDGFAEHFVERQRIHNGNWDRYYRPEDVERQMVLESYGYKFLRMNRFNLGADPVAILSERLYELVNSAARTAEDSGLVSLIKSDAEAIQNGAKKRCRKCGEIREVDSFWDPNLKKGNGGYGRICVECKGPRRPASQPYAGSLWPPTR